VPLAATAGVDIDILARPTAGGDPIHLKTLLNQSLSDLAPGDIRSIHTLVQFQSDLLDGEYDLVAVFEQHAGGVFQAETPAILPEISDFSSEFEYDPQLELIGADIFVQQYSGSAANVIDGDESILVISDEAFADLIARDVLDTFDTDDTMNFDLNNMRKDVDDTPFLLDLSDAAGETYLSLNTADILQLLDDQDAFTVRMSDLDRLSFDLDSQSIELVDTQVVDGNTVNTYTLNDGGTGVAISVFVCLSLGVSVCLTLLV